MPVDHKRELVHILQMAYSGEKAAGYAYRGHWRSVRDPLERAQIQKIEADEWDHREIVAGMLVALNAGPQPLRDIWMGMVGSVISVACHLIGWFLPMYFAGRLESANILEYEHAALHAGKLGLVDFQLELMRLSAVEREHELFFKNAVVGHPMLPLTAALFRWPLPVPAVSQGEGALTAQKEIEGSND